MALSEVSPYTTAMIYEQFDEKSSAFKNTMNILGLIGFVPFILCICFIPNAYNVTLTDEELKIKRKETKPKVQITYAKIVC